MKVFGDNEMTWRSEPDQKEHVIVATRGAAWSFLCRATSDEYETVEVDPKPSPEAIVWKHDRAKVTCDDCLAVLDGAVVTKVEVSL